MNKFFDFFIILIQWCKLNYSVRAIDNEIGNLYFEDLPISEVRKIKGLKLLLSAVAKESYDAVGINHGIKRVLIRKEGSPEFSGIIWDYRPKGKPVEISNDFTKLLEENFEAIQNEYKKVKSLKIKFPDSDSLTNNSGLWSFLPFFSKGGSPIAELHQECPVLSKIFLSAPINVTYGFCSFSILSPGTTIAAHRGSTSFRFRYHLGLEVPEPGKCKIRVGDEWIYWEQGKSFSFDDSFEHEVVHSGSKDRGILIIDLWPDRIPKNVIAFLEKNSAFKNFGVLNQDKNVILKD